MDKPPTHEWRFGYGSFDAALEEYKSLRGEIVEAQKQRLLSLQITVAALVAGAGFFLSDQIMEPVEALILIVGTVAGSLFSYSTRCREQRIADFIGVFLPTVSVWSSQFSDKPRLKFHQRSSTTIVLAMILIDALFLMLSFGRLVLTPPVDTKSWVAQWPCWAHALAWGLGAVGTGVNIVLLCKTWHLPDLTPQWRNYYEKHFPHRPRKAP